MFHLTVTSKVPLDCARSLFCSKEYLSSEVARVARARVSKTRIRAPSQLARLRCSYTLAYRFLSKRETARSLRSRLLGESLSRVEGSPAYRTYSGRANFYGSKDDAVVRALTSHQLVRVPASTVEFDVGSLLCALLWEGFIRVPKFFPLPKNQHFQIPYSIRNKVDKGSLSGCSTSKSLFA